ncbi:hypothetical protein [Candidatus Methylomirabilis limnetica]|uniref:hypothetical protein n=1 Tax=Candidatus Methylomirabilis limnetica TaxID=2033718 RepID=UPI00137A7786|nr:hypothetical protein [Candidatus Methylomirabilis limnetica]
MGSKKTRGLLPRSRNSRFSGFFYSLVMRLHDPLKFVPTEPAWWTASAGHLLGEKENEAAMNRFPGPLLTYVVPDCDALL